MPHRQCRGHRHDLDSVLSVTSRQERLLGAEISVSVAETRKRSNPTSKDQKENEYGYRNEHVETDGYAEPVHFGDQHPEVCFRKPIAVVRVSTALSRRMTDKQEVIAVNG